MVFEIDLYADPATALREVAFERLDHARHQLEARPEGLEEAIHEARKDLKKVRALARLVRGALGRDAYRRANRLARDAGRELSALRDVTALRESVEGLRARFEDDGRRPALDRLMGALAGRRDDIDTEDPEARIRGSIQRIETLRETCVPEWSLDGDLGELCEPGLIRTYRRGARALRRSRDEPTTENLHEWRKRVKDHRYHLRLTRDAWPSVVGAQRDDVRHLSELLGDDHDLAVLTDALEQTRLASDIGREPVQAMIRKRRRELQRDAFRLGSLAFSEEPTAFGRRVRRYIDVSARSGPPRP